MSIRLEELNLYGLFQLKAGMPKYGNWDPVLPQQKDKT